MIYSWGFVRFLKELSVPIPIGMTGHLVYSQIEECIILTITVLLRDKSLLLRCFAATVLGP